jgi:nicotinate-nucleotide adenylyltransferase
MKVGLLGGSFDPVHKGHLKIAHQALANGMDEVWLVVAYQPPLKLPCQASFEQRCAMVTMVLDHPAIKLCTVEATLSVPSYTINTVRALKERYPTVEFSYLIGSDQQQQLSLWHKIDELRTLVDFVVFNRNSQNDELFPESSTAVRHGRLDYVEPQILHYMIQNHLYLESWVSNQMSSDRFTHVLGCVDCAMSIAAHYDLNPDQVYLAALLHDIAKELSYEQLLSYLSDEQQPAPRSVWHQFAGASIVEHEMHVNDQAIIEAIRYHTTGDCNHLLAMIIFCADKIEPSRGYDSSELIMLAKTDIKQAFEKIKANHARFYLNGGR